MYSNVISKMLRRASTLMLTCGEVHGIATYTLCSIEFCRLPAQPLIGP